MKRKSNAYIHNVDQLIEATSLDSVLHHYGLPSPQSASGEYRMDCPFNSECSDSQYGNLTIKLNDSAKRIYCHSCNTRGNLLTLIHGLENQQPPATGRLRGQEFKAACKILQQINDGPVNDRPNDRSDGRPRTQTEPAAKDRVSIADEQPQRNTPLIRNPNEKVSDLATLCDDLVADVSEMPPEAARYFRDRPWLTNELCQKWGIGFLPMKGRSMFRGWIVYTHRNQRGEVLSYSGRDPNFYSKWKRWIRDGKPASKKPMKHRYVKGFHKGIELYGQHQQRLEDPALLESLKTNGLFIVEGTNDVVRLDQLGIAAVGTCSNRATESQTTKIAAFAKELADNRVVLMPDCDEEGEEGFKELLWQLCERGVNCQLAWSRRMLGGDNDGIQPENIADSQIEGILNRLSQIGPGDLRV